MDELTLNLNRFALPSNPNIGLLLAIPAVYTPDQSDQEWRDETARMFAHSRLTSLFTSGQISPDDYADGLAELGYDPSALDDLWVEGGSLLLL